jgi:hypothetical protein
VPDQRAKAEQNPALDRHALALGSGWHQPGGLVEHRGQALRPGPKEIADVRVGLGECEHVFLRVGVTFSKRGFRFDEHEWLHVHISAIPPFSEPVQGAWTGDNQDRPIRGSDGFPFFSVDVESIKVVLRSRCLTGRIHHEARRPN